MNYLITGGTGLIGRTLIDLLLQDGHKVWNMSRSGKPSTREGLTQLKWDGKRIPDGVKNIDAVVNLAGANIGQRWTESAKKVIIKSRVDATTACVEFIRSQENPPKVFVSASGANYYGNAFSVPKVETDPNGTGFLAEVCKAWEEAAAGSPIRTILMRITPVLSADDGALAKMMVPFKFFVGGPTGSGDQGFEWIHKHDMARAIRFFVENRETEGPYNVSSPRTITNRQFAEALGEVMNRPSFFRVPKAVLELVFGEMSVVLWGGSAVQTDKLESAGFKTEFPTVKLALQDLVKD